MSLVLANVLWAVAAIAVVVALLVVGSVACRWLHRRGSSPALGDDVREQQEILRAAAQDREGIRAQQETNEAAARTALTYRGPMV